MLGLYCQLCQSVSNTSQPSYVVIQKPVTGQGYLTHDFAALHWLLLACDKTVNPFFDMPLSFLQSS
jgi:hypothetical protein